MLQPPIPRPPVFSKASTPPVPKPRSFPLRAPTKGSLDLLSPARGHPDPPTPSPHQEQPKEPPARPSQQSPQAVSLQTTGLVAATLRVPAAPRRDGQHPSRGPGTSR